MIQNPHSNTQPTHVVWNLPGSRVSVQLQCILVHSSIRSGWDVHLYVCRIHWHTSYIYLYLRSGGSPLHNSTSSTSGRIKLKDNREVSFCLFSQLATIFFWKFYREGLYLLNSNILCLKRMFPFLFPCFPLHLQCPNFSQTKLKKNKHFNLNLKLGFLKFWSKKKSEYLWISFKEASGINEELPRWNEEVTAFCQQRSLLLILCVRKVMVNQLILNDLLEHTCCFCFL